MRVEMVKEHEDGSADVLLEDIDPRTMQMLLQEGFITILKNSLEQLEKDKKIPALFKEPK